MLKVELSCGSSRREREREKKKKKERNQKKKGHAQDGENTLKENTTDYILFV